MTTTTKTLPLIADVKGLARSAARAKKAAAEVATLTREQGVAAAREISKYSFTDGAGADAAAKYSDEQIAERLVVLMANDPIKRPAGWYLEVVS